MHVINDSGWELEWEWDSIRLWVHFVGIFVLAAVAVTGLWKVAMPVTTTMTTRHELAYVPARIELVKDLTNVFSERQGLGGSGGVGTPQVERSNDAYRMYERDVVHYAVIRTVNNRTMVDYYDLTDIGVFHSFVGPYEAPEHKTLGFTVGFYGATGGALRDNVLTLDRTFVVGDSMFGMSMAVIAVSTLLYITLLRRPVNTLLLSVKRWYLRR